MMRGWLCRFLAVAIWFGSMAPVQAWNATGHMTVDLIAYRRLSDDQRKQIGEILKSHPHYQSYLLEGKPDDLDQGEWAFLKAGCWADYIRPGMDKSEHKSESLTKYHHGAWHYVDYPFVLPKDRDKFDLAKIQPAAENLLSVLPERIAALGHVEATDEARQQRAIDLCWVAHLVGDMHQPLHCVSMYSEAFKQGDMGGNSQAIRPREKPMNLHWYWDELLGTGTDYLLIDQLAQTITANPAYDPTKMPEIKQHTTLASWVAEGFEGAKAIVYLGGELKTANWKGVQSQQIKAEETPELPNGYEINSRQYACRRVALAGYRLADILAQALR